MNIIAIAGSLRHNSFNVMALRAAQRLAPAGMSIQEAQIGDVPFYNDDIHRAGDPASVIRLRTQLKTADAVLLVSPEYNFSIPGVLKNALDWMSRPPNALDGMPVAIMGASIGPLGTARAQYHLRQVLQCLNAYTVSRPEVFIPSAQTKFDAQGELADDIVAAAIVKLLIALRDLVSRLQTSGRSY